MLSIREEIFKKPFNITPKQSTSNKTPSITPIGVLVIRNWDSTKMLLKMEKPPFNWTRVLVRLIIRLERLIRCWEGWTKHSNTFNRDTI